MNRKRIYIILLGFLISSCNNQEQLSEKDLAEWFRNPENEAIQKMETENLEVLCFYKSIDYIIASEFKGTYTDSMVRKNRRAELGDYLYFELSFKSKQNIRLLDDKNIKPELKKKRENYLRFDIESQIKLKDQNDNMKEVSIFHLERNYGVSPYTKMIFAFEKNKQKEIELIISNQFIDTTELKFEFDLSKMPSLVL